MTRRKRRPFFILFGLVALLAGFAIIGVGVAAVLKERDRIEDEAAARDVLPAAVTFEAEAREYRVWILDGGEEAAWEVACQTSSGVQFTGSRQGSHLTIGGTSSVGTFDAPAGQVTVSCAGRDGTAFVVTPTGGSLLRTVLTIVAGAFVSVAGLLLIIFGLVGRRVRV